MKILIPALALLIPAVASAAASAPAAMVYIPSVPRVRIDAPINPIAELPRYLPGPKISPLGIGIRLPSVQPSPLPAVIVPGPASPVLRLPSVIAPVGRILPGAGIVSIPIRAAEQARAPRLDDVFDGRRAPERAPAIQPISPSRRITLPEADLERELGL